MYHHVTQMLSLFNLWYLKIQKKRPERIFPLISILSICKPLILSDIKSS